MGLVLASTQYLRKTKLNNFYTSISSFKRGRFFLWFAQINNTPRLSLQEQAMFARRLALLSQSGVPLLEALHLLKNQMTGVEQRMLSIIIADVSEGQYLSKSLKRYKKVFGNFAINIIEVGETTGMFSDNLLYLSQEIDKKRELRSKIIGALTYPIIIMCAALLMAGFLTIYLFPKLIPVFKSLQVKLPLATRALIWTSQFLTDYGLWLLLALLLLTVCFGLAVRREDGREIFEHMTLRVFVVGDLLRCYYLTNFCRTLGLLLKGQLSILEATMVIVETSANLPYRRELEKLVLAITRGVNVSTQLEKNSVLFPNMLTGMISIGERTGNLPGTFLHLADIYEQELEEKTKRLSSLIEPAMMLIMGLVVGFIAISIITPIYAVTQHIK